MKRSFQEELTELDQSLNMANCLMFLSQQRRDNYDGVNKAASTSTGKVFECKTCNKQFTSFQALGGHRASHKKPRLTEEGNGGIINNTQQQSPMKTRTHECSVCGVEFAIGQALGGHMRRHRAGGALHGNQKLSSDLSSLLPDTAPLVKKANNGRRVLSLDLNLTPYENDLELYRHNGSKLESLVDLKLCA